MTDESPGAIFAPLSVVNDDVRARLQAQLADAAEASGLLDIAYRTIDTPVGRLLLAATDVGPVRVAFECEDHDLVLANLAERVSPRILKAPRRLDSLAAALDEYFSGRRHSFDLRLDYRLTTAFRREVLAQLPGIGFGTTASYATIAKRTGRPRAVRAVGTACATNPLPVVVPCHRVVRTDGGVGHYIGGIDAKIALLKLESSLDR